MPQRCPGPFGDSPEPTSELSRRHWITRVAGGMGAWALLSLLERDGFAGTLAPSISDVAAGIPNPLAPRPPHFPAKAKSVIFLMMAGGPSQMDTFDPKPLLNRLDGQRLPDSFGTVQTEFTDVTKDLLMGSRIPFRACGQSGLPISNAFPHLQQQADKLAVIRSCHHDAITHPGGRLTLLTGMSRIGYPSVGAWLTYGLGSVSQNLPAMVVLTNPEGLSKDNRHLWGNGFLPAHYQGTMLRPGSTPFLYAHPPASVTDAAQRRMLDLSQTLNRRHAHEISAATAELESRIANYELAYRMQSAAPEAVDLSKESDATKKLYGLDEEATKDFGTRCLLARRMVERGVRFVQIISGPSNWDHHDDCHNGTLEAAKQSDQPIAALLQDLEARGLLEETLVVWTGEFGRTPTSQAGKGRDHNPWGYTMWMAGGGVQGGRAIGSTDELGLRAVEDRAHIHDIHATILSLLGLDHRKLTYLHQGREMRLTDIGGDNDLARRLLG